MLSTFRKKYQKSLSRTMLIKMSISMSIVILTVTLITYLYVISILESQTMEQLRKHTVERGQRETTLFSLLETGSYNMLFGVSTLTIPIHEDAVDGRDKMSQKWSLRIEPPGRGIGDP